ncbi:hypothetical protein [Streptomyces lydicus]|uniref:hypothetical protein n=1 Tax=Streptomyces lydicus TaxID=47763 RepID=UPI001012C10E|nr:hypothetical protein [Streptomyces lydicus]MCZ1008662.1 hypothetical protein [Streptomyces lydicus]
MRRLAQYQYAVVGSAVLLACVACTSGEGEGKRSALPASDSAGPSRLHQLPKVDLQDDLLSEQDSLSGPEERKVIGEVRNGADRIVVYVAGRRCGLATTREGDQKNLSIHVLDTWPKDGTQGAADLPYGPYSDTSANGSGGTWASLSCGKDAMVVKFRSPNVSKELKHRGSLDVIKPTSAERSVSVVVGEKGIREKVRAALQSHS